MRPWTGIHVWSVYRRLDQSASSTPGSSWFGVLDNTNMAVANPATMSDVHAGIRGTVSKETGSHESNDSPRVKVPPNEAVSNTHPEAKAPAEVCTMAELGSFHTARPRCHRVQSRPMPNPNPTMARLSLFTSSG